MLDFGLRLSKGKQHDSGNRRVATLIAIGVSAVLAAVIFLRQIPSNTFGFIASPEAAPSPATSLLATVRRDTLRKLILLDGELRAVRSRTIYSDTTEEAKIVFMPPEGTIVKAGEKILELDSSAVLTRIKDSEDRIVAADNEIVRTQSQQEAALRDLEVEFSRLWLSLEQAKLKAKIPSEVLARREYQDAQLALEKARTEYDNHLLKIEQKKKEQAAELQVKIIERDKMKVQLDRARANLNGMRIPAPADGMVIYNEHWNERRKIQVGDVVWSGWPIIRLPDLSEMEVLAQVNEVDGPKLTIGSKAEIRLDSYPDTSITGAVKDISQTATKAGWMSKAKIFRVTISLDRTETEFMKPGMSAQIGVIINETPSALLVPRPSLRFEGDSPMVTRLEPGDIRRNIAVNILASDAVHYAIADNGALKEADKIMVR